jgi:predicted dehydrogenase
MSEVRLGIIMNGVTGRMGKNQHLIRSILAIQDQGGVKLANGDSVMPDPILVGRNAQKVEALAKELNVERWTTDLDAALENKNDRLFFDSASTQLRVDLLKKAMDAGKDVYCEKPIAETLDVAMDIVRYAAKAGVKNGVVHDKLSLPGLIKLAQLIEEGFFGRILSVKGDFGYWVFEGDDEPAQRPSWNYRKQDGGGIMLDMLCHWRYVFENIFGAVTSVSSLGANHIQKRWDENDGPYEANTDDAAYSTFELEGGIVAQMNSSWCTRVNRSDLVTFQVDGTEGSAVAGLHKCVIQSLADTPKPVWNPDEPRTNNFLEDWKEYQPDQEFDNGFKVQWEMFIRHLFEGAPWKYTLLEGAKGVQLAELGLKSWQERRWIDLPDLEV